jgi:hypothetical protein
LYKIAIRFCESRLRRKSRMILDEAEPEVTAYVHVTAVLPVNVVILTRISKRLRQFIGEL